MLHPAVRMPTIYFTALLLMRLLLVLAVVLSFAQRQVHAQPPLLRFSTPALALILASEFVQAQPPEFEVVGDGACTDCGASAFYDYIRFMNGSGATVTSKDECESLCVACASEVSSSNPNREFRGFVWLPSFLDCACYFDDDSVDFTNECQNMSTCSGAASPFSYESTRNGNGVMCSSTGNTLSECSKLTAPFPSNYVRTECPSSVPSTSPSTTPSEVPSDIPSISPSSSSMPSESPSDVPSTLPSASDLPSNQPSVSTSTEPSSEQSSTPSCSPSNSPTESPSVKDGINLFYPDWAKGGETCRNDGDHPDYMEINPTEWLSSSLDACCKKFFGGFLYKQCIGAYPPDDNDCNLMLFFPDWNGANLGCLDDGKEPYYMLSNHQYFLSNTREECCEKFYEWDFYSCSGTTPELTHGEWYPDWSGGGSTCLADGEIPVPDYMLSNQNWYLSTTLETCCERHFYWDINECLGITVVGTDKWYVSYEDMKCVQDCSGGALPCGGVANPWEELFNSKENCCKEKLSWLPRCRSN